MPRYRSVRRNSIRHFSTSFWNGSAAVTTACTRSARFSKNGILGRLRRRHVVRRKHIGRAAELAGDGDHAVLDHVVAIFLRKALEHVFDAVARARALRIDRRSAEDAHAALMEQP